jgi:hypothetical protein
VRSPAVAILTQECLSFFRELLHSGEGSAAVLDGFPESVDTTAGTLTEMLIRRSPEKRGEHCVEALPAGVGRGEALGVEGQKAAFDQRREIAPKQALGIFTCR